MAIMIIAMIIAYAQELGAQELTLCRSRPADSISQWSYRSNVSGRPEPCWYRGERMRDRRLLFWEQDPAKPVGDMLDPVLVPSHFDDRFAPLDKPGG